MSRDIIQEMMNEGDRDEFTRFLRSLGSNVLLQLINQVEDGGAPVNVEYDDPMLVFSVQAAGVAFRLGAGTPVSLSIEEVRSQISRTE